MPDMRRRIRLSRKSLNPASPASPRSGLQSSLQRAGKEELPNEPLKVLPSGLDPEELDYTEMTGTPAEDEDAEEGNGEDGGENEGENEGDEEDSSPESQRLQKIHAESIEEFHDIQDAMREERKLCLEDRRFAFIAGAQWEGDQEQFKNVPMLEFNMTAQAIEQIMTDYRENQIDAQFVSKDGALDLELADTVAAIHRADKQDSCAEEAFSNAFEEAVTGGIGGWRLTTVYEDEENDEEDGPQRIRFEPIYEADRFVFFDLNSRRRDKSDARSCYIITPLTRKEYEKKYPDDDVSSWEEDVHCTQFDWAPPDMVYVAERFVVEYVPDTKITYRPPGAPGEDVYTVDGERLFYRSQLTEDPAIESDLLALGWQKVAERKVKRKRIRKYILNGKRILKDCGFIRGREIPVVLVDGRRFFVDNIERVQGHVRRARDPQRIKNMLVSKLADFAGQSSTSKPIFTPEQIEAHDATWANDNLERRPYLPVDPVTNAEGQKEPMGPLGFTQPTPVPPAIVELSRQTDVDMQRILGNPNEGQEVKSHTSSKTVDAVQRRIDGKSSLFISNMGKAIRRSGQIYLSMMSEVYTQPGRRLKGVGPMNEPQRVELMKPVIREQGEEATGGLVLSNDLTRVQFDVTIDIGPSSETRREAAFEAGINMQAVTEDPEAKTVLTYHNIMNMRGEGVAYLRKWARKVLVKQGVFPPTPEEAKALEAAAANAQPGPIEQLALAQAQEALAKVKELAAKIELEMAQVGKTKAETIKTLADVNMAQQAAQADTIKALADVEVARETARISNMKTLADASLERQTAEADAAKSLHDMRMAEVAAQQSSTPGDGSKPSGSSQA